MRSRFTSHAVHRMRRFRLTVADIEAVLTTGDVVEQYPDDRPWPSRLVVGWCGGRPVHVVAADDQEIHDTIVITAYVPEPDRWDPTFRIRRPR